MKKVVLIIVMMISISFFVGCGQNQIKIDDEFILNGISFEQSGKIVQEVAISVNSKAIEKKGKQGEYIQFKANLIGQMEKIRQQFLLNYAVKYLANPIDEFKIGQGVKLSSVTYRENQDAVGFQIQFSSVDAWKFYLGQGVNGDGQAQAGPPIFIRKIISSASFPFAAEVKEGQSVANIFKKCYVDSAKGLSFEGDLAENYKPMFVYCYSTPFTKLRSNCDAMIKNGLNTHIWVADEGEMDGKQITLYYHQINYANWLIMALAVPISVFLFVCVGINIIKLKRKRVR